MSPIKLAIVFSFVSVFSPLFAVAQEQCSSIFSSTYALSGRIEIASDAKLAPPAITFEDTIRKIDSLLSPLAVPVETRILVGPDFLKSSFDAESFEIYVGLHPESMGKKHPQIHQTILGHEYGHAIFEINLMKDLESYKQLRADALQLETTLRKTIGEAKALKYQHDVTFHNKVKKGEIETHALDKALEAKALAANLTAHRKYWAIRSGFSELFADAIALVATKDPRAIQALLADRSKKLKKHSSLNLLLRDFTDGQHHLNRQKWLKEQIFISGLLGDVYYAFLPARWELWNISKNRIKSDNYRRELAYKVFSILERNLSEILAKNPTDLGFSGFKDLEKVNQQLIEDFHREL